MSAEPTSEHADIILMHFSRRCTRKKKEKKTWLSGVFLPNWKMIFREKVFPPIIFVHWIPRILKVRLLSVALTNFCIKDIRTVSTELCKLNQTIGTFICQFKTIEWESNRLSRPLFFRRLAKLLQSHNLTGGIFNASIARVSWTGWRIIKLLGDPYKRNPFFRLHMTQAIMLFETGYIDLYCY